VHALEIGLSLALALKHLLQNRWHASSACEQKHVCFFLLAQGKRLRCR